MLPSSGASESRNHSGTFLRAPCLGPLKMKIYLHVHSSFFSSILIYYSKCLKNNINTEKKLIKDLFGTFCGTFFVPFQDLLGLLIDSNIKVFFIIIHIFLLFQLSKCLKNNINTDKKRIKEISRILCGTFCGTFLVPF